MQTDINRIPVNRQLLERFFKNVRTDPTITFNGSPCWLWINLPTDGYGKFSYAGLCRNAHRMAFEMFDHIMPKRNHADHLCRNRGCVNPAHVEDVSGRINTHRGDGPAGKNVRKTHCDWGHEFTPENTRYYGPEKRFRDCKACRKRTDAALWRKSHPERTHCKRGHLYEGQPPTADHHRCGLCVKLREKARVRK